MSVVEWEVLYSSLSITKWSGRPFLPKPTKEDLDAFEQEWEIKLPKSFREYAPIFGSGTLGRRFDIATPGYGRRARHDIAAMNRSKCIKQLRKWEELELPDQLERAIFFCETVGQDYIFFDPADITDRRNHEYGIYALLRLEKKAKKIAESFKEFIETIVLRGDCRKVNYGRLPKRDRMNYQPAHK
jgi:hypothetical protein